jgi:hypothetical protein
MCALYISIQMRELKVEDALLYLDQVKVEFGDQVRIFHHCRSHCLNHDHRNTVCVVCPSTSDQVLSL